jgi:hypothetical protein
VEICLQELSILLGLHFADITSLSEKVLAHEIFLECTRGVDLNKRIPKLLSLSYNHALSAILKELQNLEPRMVRTYNTIS